MSSFVFGTSALLVCFLILTLDPGMFCDLYPACASSCFIGCLCYDHCLPFLTTVLGSSPSACLSVSLPLDYLRITVSAKAFLPLPGQNFIHPSLQSALSLAPTLLASPDTPWRFTTAWQKLLGNTNESALYSRGRAQGNGKPTTTPTATDTVLYL